MKLKYLLSVLPIATLLAGCGQTPLSLSQSTASKMAAPTATAMPLELVVYPNDRPSIPDGGAVFKQQCASCHSGAGDAKFNQQWAQATKPIDIYRTIAFGGDDPNRGQRHHKAFSAQLSVQDLWNLTVYVRSLGQPALNDVKIAEVDSVFGSNCAVCHGTKGDGDGPLARNLEPMPANFQRFDRFFNRTDDVLFDHIANGIRWEGMPNFLGKKDVKKNVTFDEAYIRQLVQYVRKFHINHAAVLTANAPKPQAPTDPAAAEEQNAKDYKKAPKSGNEPPKGAQ